MKSKKSGIVLYEGGVIILWFIVLLALVFWFSTNGTDPKADILGNKDFSLTIDYSLSLKVMIAKGDYDIEDSRINKYSFPVRVGGVVNVTARLFHWDYSLIRDYNMSRDEVVKCIQDSGYSLAGLAELLAVGYSHPDWQNRFRIVALDMNGWVGEDFHQYLTLGPGYIGKRILKLDRGEHWTHKDYFLGIKNN